MELALAPLKRLRDISRLSRFSHSPSGNKHERPDDVIWALRHVSFEVERGEVLGIIGPNGAGKTTLLKILSRITEPTEGRAQMRGRVSSLLEVGTGFHPELTGRENILLNGAILGMRRADVRRKVDEIRAFAEIEKFVDTPVKRYSSGMYVRLAFAVAAHLEPEVLLVDEVLAVGDVAFQRKCMGKMDTVARQGRTVLFVSHNMASIKRLCTSVMRFSDGSIIDKGRPRSVTEGYLQDSLTRHASVELPDKRHSIRSCLQIRTVEVLNARHQPSRAIGYGENLCIRLGVRATEAARGVRIGIGIHSGGIRLSTLHTPPIDVPACPRNQQVTCTIPGNTLLPGFYEVQVGAHSQETGRGLDWVPDALNFTITPIPNDEASEYDEKEKGLVRLDAVWNGDLL